MRAAPSPLAFERILRQDRFTVHRLPVLRRIRPLLPLPPPRRSNSAPLYEKSETNSSGSCQDYSEEIQRGVNWLISGSMLDQRSEIIRTEGRMLAMDSDGSSDGFIFQLCFKLLLWLVWFVEGLDDVVREREDFWEIGGSMVNEKSVILGNRRSLGKIGRGL